MNLPPSNPFPGGSRRGLTLIELVVVLSVLVALAGIASLVAPDLLRRTSAATGAAAADGLNRALEVHRLLNGTFPDGFDSLLEAPYTLYRRLPAGSLRQLRPRDLDNEDRPILRAAGITTTWRHDTNAAEGVTFAPLTSHKAFDAAAGGFAADDMAELHPSRVNVNALFGAGTRKGTPTEVFLVMGVGSRCTLVGPGGGLMEAPVSFGGTAGTHPARFYQRYGVVFRLDRADREKVRFLGAVVFDDDGIKTAGTKVRGWYR